MVGGISRRRCIHIAAAAAGLAVPLPSRAAISDQHLVVWHGTLFGAAATMKMHHQERDEAAALITAAYAEARRLERMFSLYLEDSDLVRLNRTGILVAPAAEFVDLLHISLRFADLTGGAFDPTVQPLWRLYADHFSASDADPAGPSREAKVAALAQVGHRRVSVSRDRIVMPKGMADRRPQRDRRRRALDGLQPDVDGADPCPVAADRDRTGPPDRLRRNFVRNRRLTRPATRTRRI